METAKNVIVIPAKKKYSDQTNASESYRKRVAAYARVSTIFEEQLSSFKAQKDYYEKYIKSKSEWEFVKIYADEGISATSTKNRIGFNRMIEDALAGKMDLIVTKSVSRFARNTVDTLTAIRKLKDKNVEVFFEKENIFSFDSKGELMLTIISSLAQAESQSISTNTTWGKRKRFADGKVSLPYGQFLGYEKGEDGLPKIVEKQAKIIRRIYRLFLEGKTPSGIATIFTGEKIPTPGGKTKWSSSTVKSILTNEKYKGDALLQKTLTVNFLTKKKKINTGEVPQYYVENSHPAIVEPQTFELVQEEFRRRKAAGKCTSAINCFASRITCGDCGGFYGRKVWHSNTKYQATIWQCNNKFQKRKHCTTPHLKEEVIKQAFVNAFNSLIENKDKLITDCEVIIGELLDTSEVDKRYSQLGSELIVVEELILKMIKENAAVAIDQVEYGRRYNEFIERYKCLKEKQESVEVDRQQKKVRIDKIRSSMKMLRKQEALIDEFNEVLWNTLIENVVVKDHRIEFMFKDGTVIERKL